MLWSLILKGIQWPQYDPEYDTDELAELLTDSEPETAESEPGEENAQIEEQ